MPVLWWWWVIALWAASAPPPRALWGHGHFARDARWVILPTAEPRAAGEPPSDTAEDQSWEVTEALERARLGPGEREAISCTPIQMIRLDEQPLRALRCDRSHEHEGMYGDREVVLVALGEDPAVPEAPGGFEQWVRHVHDNASVVVRRRVAPLAGGGFCVETSSSEGPGLFTVMKDTPWRPQTHRKVRTAWRVGSQGFEATPPLDRRCPTRGYADLVPNPKRFEDSVSRSLRTR